MAETIHFSEKFRTALAKYYAYKSVTDHAFNHNIDSEFSGSDHRGCAGRWTCLHRWRR